MFSYATKRGGYERVTARRLSAWAKDHLRKAALAGFGCAVAGVFLAAWIRSGSDATGAYLTLSLALSALWIITLQMEGFDARFVGVSLTAAIAISYALSIELSRGYLATALPSITLFGLGVRYAGGKRLREPSVFGRRGRNVVAADAGQRKKLLAAHTRDHVLFKSRKVPWITGTGQNLRRWSAGELPQLVNEVLEPMSLAVRVRPSRMRRPSMPTTSAVGWWPSPA